MIGPRSTFSAGQARTSSGRPGESPSEGSSSAEDGAARLAVLVPVRDEAETLGFVVDGLRRFLPPETEVLVIDDGSTDGSGSVAKMLGARVVRHPVPLGYGASLKTGLAHTSSTRVAIIDGDGTYAPDDLARMVESFEDGGMVIGTRAWEPSPLRRFAKSFFRAVVEARTGLSVPDLNSGARVFDRRIADRLRPHLPPRFSFTTTLTLGAIALGVPVRFEPVRFLRRRGGRSKFTLRDTWAFGRTVLRGCEWIRSRAIPLPSTLEATPEKGPSCSSPFGSGSFRVLTLLVALFAIGFYLLRTAPIDALLAPVLFGALTYLPFVVAKVLRWQRLLASSGVAIPFRDAFRAYVAGLAFGAVTPGRVGEILRIALPYSAGHPLGVLAATTAIDRLLDVAALGLAASTLVLSSSGAESIGWLSGAAAAAALFVAILVEPTTTYLATRFQGLERGRGHAEGGPHHGTTGLARAQSIRSCFRPRVLLPAIGWTAISIGLFLLIASFLLRSAGAAAPERILWGAAAFGNLAALLPLSIGGVGTREAAILASLAGAGFATTPDAAALYSVAFHAIFTLMPWILFALVACVPPRAGVAPDPSVLHHGLGLRRAGSGALVFRAPRERVDP